MSAGAIRLIAIGGGTLGSILIVSGGFRLLGADDAGLQATFIAMLSASLSLAIHARLSPAPVSIQAD